MAVKLIIDGAAVQAMLHSPDGVVGRYMIGKSQVVQNAAIRDCPKRTGKLSESIVKRFYDTTEGFTVVIAALQSYALPVHEGTKPHMIYPKNAKVLSWVSTGGANFSGAQRVFAKSVHHPGTAPRRFLTDNMYLFYQPFPS